MLYFLYKLLSLFFLATILLLILYLFLQKKFFKKNSFKRNFYILSCFACVILVTLILWCHVYFSFYEYTVHLNTVFSDSLMSKSKKEVVALIGQKPTDVSFSKDSNGNLITVVFYEYHFPFFNYFFYRFTFINDEWASKTEGYSRKGKEMLTSY